MPTQYAGIPSERMTKTRTARSANRPFAARPGRQRHRHHDGEDHRVDSQKSVGCNRSSTMSRTGSTAVPNRRSPLARLRMKVTYCGPVRIVEMQRS